MYKKLAIFTIAAVYFLILVGGVVRATGSGMGCPDWPKCFGTWIPPTDVSQLPENYQAVFGEKLKGEVVFNAFKTWTEYINRLVGVLIGIFIFATLLLSIKEYWGSNRKVVFFSFLAFVAVGLEGYLGSKVVSTELNPFLITIHMLLAIVVVFLLIKALTLVFEFEGKFEATENRSNRFLILVLMALSFIQLILGTQIRESVDSLYLAGMDRVYWWESLKGGRLYMHIVLAIILLVLHFWFYRNVKEDLKSRNSILLKALISLIVLEFTAGAVLGLFKLPAAFQPVHLLLATLILGLQYGMFLMFTNSKKAIS